MRPGPGKPFSIGSGSLSAITTLPSHARQAYLGRMCSSTIIDAGTYSSCSRTSRPMHVRSTPQSGQRRCSRGTSCRIGLRGRLAGSGLRPWPFFLDSLGIDVGSDFRSEVAAGLEVASACARISWANSKS